jgi:uncharacterized DUF497 family protein
MIEFEWDEIKRERNIKLNRLDFIDILPIFSAQEILVFQDIRNDYGEQRFILMGEFNTMFYLVVFTIRQTKIRIISASRGNKRERLFYEKKQRTGFN